MADDKKTAAVSSETVTVDKKTAAVSSETVTVDIKNPTRARRVIYDGINVERAHGHGPAQKQITVEPGETKKNVTVHRSVVEEMRARNRAKKDSDLIITPARGETDEEKSAA